MKNLGIFILTIIILAVPYFVSAWYHNSWSFDPGMILLDWIFGCMMLLVLACIVGIFLYVFNGIKDFFR